MWLKDVDDNIINSRGRTGALIVRSGTTKYDSSGRKRVYIKEAEGGGRKREDWVEWIYMELVGEFDCLRKLGVKFSPIALRTVAKDVFERSEHD